MEGSVQGLLTTSVSVAHHITTSILDSLFTTALFSICRHPPAAAGPPEGRLTAGGGSARERGV